MFLGSITLPVVRSNIEGIKGKKVMIFQTKDKGIVKLQSGISRKISTRIHAIEWEEDYGRSGGKAAVGSIVGGVLTGGIGFIAGAAIGGRKRDTSTAVIVTTKGEEMRVSMNAKQYEKVRSWL